MIKPTAEEVTAYALLIGFKLNGHHFCDYYESKGWVVGKSPMKDWRAAVRTWKHNSPESSKVGQFYDRDKADEREKQLELIKQREIERKFGSQGA